jgi:hypothetical protein
MGWQKLEKPWHDTNVEYCDVCGNLLIDRAWVFTGPDGSTLRACRESDEPLHARLRGFEPRIAEARQAYERQRDRAGGRT